LGNLTSFQPSNADRRNIIDDLKLGMVCFNSKILVHGRTTKNYKSLLRKACLHIKGLGLTKYRETMLNLVKDAFILLVFENKFLAYLFFQKY
jgi:hypothetical protein